MNSSQPGTGILPSEVTNIEALGFWVLVEDREYFVPFADYPVFKGASIQQIFQDATFISHPTSLAGFGRGY